uniref:MULE transposase domain-containing protein n=1 Tax=Lactuca sativa TaxID=4236 RepID=A0A9R1WN15_LACSA|nr:hypothetical protein LSAT_V11C100001570 [Lactuca sativa]
MQCPFRVATGWKYNERTFHIKFCNEIPMCARNYHFGSLVTSNWLAKHHLKDVIMKPKMTLLEMQADVLQRGRRRVIGLDGSFLKGHVKGEILTAIGRDADNHVYPIAWATMNVENKDNLTWFIVNLVDDLDLGVGNGLVVISDQHMKQDTPILWQGNLKPSAKPSFLIALENGVVECYNGMIKEIKKKHILTMLEEIRILLMKRFYHQGQEVAKWKGNFGPNIQLNIDEFGKDMRLWTVVPSGGDVFESRHDYNGYKVDLATHTCTCNLWMLSGIPYVYSQAAINYIHKDPNQFLSSWFHKDKYVATYSQNIQPIGGSNLWSRTKFIKPLPPPVRRMHGGPKLKRVKHTLESQDVKYPSQRLNVPRTMMQHRENLKQFFILQIA